MSDPQLVLSVKLTEKDLEEIYCRKESLESQLRKKIEKLERTIKHLKRRLKGEKEEHEMTLSILIEDYEKLLEKK